MGKEKKTTNIKEKGRERERKTYSIRVKLTKKIGIREKERGAGGKG